MFKRRQQTVDRRQDVSTDGARPTAGMPATSDPLEPQRPAAGRPRLWLSVAVGLVLVAAGAVVAVAGPFAASGSAKGGERDNGYPTSLAAVMRGSLSSQTSLSGTLGYAGGYSVVNELQGTFTALPDAGEVVGCGRVLYRVSNSPVVLLCGRVPAYRSLYQGDAGPDVRELNANLVALGYATRAELDPASDCFSAETAYALERLQAKLGVAQTGSLELGSAVFLPGPLRITTVAATLGTGAATGAPVALATSTGRQVTVNLDAAQQSIVQAGDRVAITLPNDDTTSGVVTSVGKVASSSNGSTTIPVYIAPLAPRVAGSLDQAPVQVQIITARVKDAMIVPVDALLAPAGGGYAVETADHGIHRLVAVTLGLFDDAAGLVQVISQNLQAGERVVVPAT